MTLDIILYIVVGILVLVGILAIKKSNQLIKESQDLINAVLAAMNVDSPGGKKVTLEEFQGILKEAKEVVEVITKKNGESDGPQDS